VWRFDLSTNTFAALTPATPDGPIPGRQGHVATFDFPRNRMVVFGGIDGAGTLAPSEVWALDFTVVPPAWRKVTTTGTPPSARFGMAAAQDVAHAKWFLFGGSTDLGAGLSELFTFDLATNAWTQVHGRNAASSPGDRVNAMGAFDPVARVFLLEGGTNSTSRVDQRELWAFDVASSSWRAPITDGPVARGKGAFFEGSPPYLFSGIASLLMAPASMAQDFWSLDVSATPPWTQQPAAGPPARFSAASTARDGKLYVFAGGTTGGSGQSVLTDLWSYDPGTRMWTRLDAGTGALPPGKLAASMVGR